MELVQKGAEAPLTPFRSLKGTMSWSSATDFDLAVAYETKTGQKGLVYFGDKGSTQNPPHIALDGDAGVGDAGGDNAETMTISKIDHLKHVYILAWDYTQVQSGQPARFQESDVKVSFKDDNGINYDLQLDTGDIGNVAVLAHINNSGGTPVLSNTSVAATLKGLKNSQQLFQIITEATAPAPPAEATAGA